MRRFPRGWVWVGVVLLSASGGACPATGRAASSKRATDGSGRERKRGTGNR